ncbi:MAG: acylglycerol kinase family protein [Christensenella sp.]|nr:MAG: acylglycerol kinase family protein [Christensenella sp.]
MQNCLIIINKNAGSSKKISFEKVEKCLGDDYSYKHCTIPDDEIENFSAYDALAVCGGDGTLASILEKSVRYAAQSVLLPRRHIERQSKGRKILSFENKMSVLRRRKG